MNIEHLHFQKLGSTQSFLQSHAQGSRENILASCSWQTKGKGRGDNTWEHFSQNVYFSFTLTLKNNDALSLQLGNILTDYLWDNWKQKIKLKWPNDLLLPNGNKCGGILINKKAEQYIVGIGLNINNPVINNLNFNPGHLQLEKLPLNYKKSLPHEIYSFVLKQNLKFDLPKWNKNCAHLNKIIEVKNSQIYKGLFLGANEDGSIILDSHGKKQIITSGSLRIL